MKRETFGYVRGGYARVLERYNDVLIKKGVEIRLNSGVESIERQSNGKIRIETKLARRHKDAKPSIAVQKTKYAAFQAVAVAPGFSGAFISEPEVVVDNVTPFPDETTAGYFDHVILTCPSNHAAKMLTDADEGEREKLEGIRYQGIVCASVMLRSSLSNYYVTNITDESPFTGIIEMSAIVDKKEFSQNALVYLPRYVAPDDELFDKTDAEIEEIFLDGLEKMYPHFKREDVVVFKISRVRQVFPIPVVNYSEGLADMISSVEGVDIVNSSHIVNGTLNINETVQLAERYWKEMGREYAQNEQR